MEVSSLVALVLPVQIHEVRLIDAAAIIQTLELLGPGVDLVVLGGHVSCLSFFL